MPHKEPLLAEKQILESLQRSCSAYKDSIKKRIENIATHSTLWKVESGTNYDEYETTGAIIVARSQVYHYYKFHYEREPTKHEMDAMLKKSQRYTGSYSTLKHDYVIYTEEEKNEKIEKLNGKITAIQQVEGALNNLELSNADKIAEATKLYLTLRDTLEEDISKKESPSLSFICCASLLVILTIPLAPMMMIAASLTLAASVLFPDKDDSPQPLDTLMKKNLKENSILALENECLIFKKQLKNKISTYTMKKGNLPLKKPHDTLDKKITNAQQKINYLDNLLTTIFNNSEMTSDQKLNKFEEALNKIKTEPNHLLAEKKNTRTRLFLHTVGHIFSTIITLGAYAGIRAAYEYHTRDTLKFWQTKKDTFKENTSSILASSIKKKP